jgi:hypothetical protein
MEAARLRNLQIESLRFAMSQLAMRKVSDNSLVTSLEHDLVLMRSAYAETANPGTWVRPQTSK